MQKGCLRRSARSRTAWQSLCFPSRSQSRIQPASRRNCSKAPRRTQEERRRFCAKHQMRSSAGLLPSIITGQNLSLIHISVLFRVFLAVLFRSHCHLLNIPQVHAYSATITGGPVPSYAGRSLSAGSSCVNSRAVPLLPCTNRQFSYGPFSRYYVAVVAINFRLRLLYRALFRLSTGKMCIRDRA